MLFVNDISQHIYSGTANLFADDCLIYCKGNNPNDVDEMFKKCIDNVSTWYDKKQSMFLMLINVIQC